MQIFSGIDSVEIDRIKKSMESETFMRRVFSEKEHELFKIRNYPPETVAANFCVKEAVAKTLGTGISGFSLREISALRDGRGAPYIELSGRAEKLFEGISFSVSITHTDRCATAVVIAYRN